MMVDQLLAMLFSKYKLVQNTFCCYTSINSAGWKNILLSGTKDEQVKINKISSSQTHNFLPECPPCLLRMDETNTLSLTSFDGAIFFVAFHRPIMNFYVIWYLTEMHDIC